MKLPGPDHPITITRNAKRVRVTFAGTTIADSANALVLKEASYQAGVLHPARRRRDGGADAHRQRQPLPL